MLRGNDGGEHCPRLLGGPTKLTSRTYERRVWGVSDAAAIVVSVANANVSYPSGRVFTPSKRLGTLGME